MYLRRNKKKGGETYEYWSLVESVRSARGPRQRTVATIGKLPGLDREERIGWEEIRRIVTGAPREPELFETEEEPPSWATIDIRRVSVERLRHFGDVYLGLLIWNKLGFADFCTRHMTEGKEGHTAQHCLRPVSSGRVDARLLGRLAPAPPRRRLVGGGSLPDVSGRKQGRRRKTLPGVSKPGLAVFDDVAFYVR
jgi:hypothetical protein